MSEGGLLGLLARFGLAGLANTAVGFAVIAALDVGLRWPPAAANAAGYAVGIGLGFMLNRGFVFRSGGGQGVLARYLAVVAVAFAVNQGVLHAARPVLGEAPTMRLLAQLMGMAAYTALTFVLCRYFVFTRAASASTAGQSASNT